MRRVLGRRGDFVVSGYDDRFAFSIPIYCSLNVGEEKGILGDTYRANPAALVWDDDRGLAARGNAHTLLHRQYRFGQRLLRKQRFRDVRTLQKRAHAHRRRTASQPVPCGDGGRAVFLCGQHRKKRAPRFPQSPLNRIKTERPSFTGGDAAVEATLWYTDAEITQTTPEWSSRRCAVNGTSVAYSVPEGAKYFYIHIDDGGLGISTRVVKL